MIIKHVHVFFGLCDPFTLSTTNMVNTWSITSILLLKIRFFIINESTTQTKNGKKRKRKRSAVV